MKSQSYYDVSMYCKHLAQIKKCCEYALHTSYTQKNFEYWYFNNSLLTRVIFFFGRGGVMISKTPHQTSPRTLTLQHEFLQNAPSLYFIFIPFLDITGSFPLTFNLLAIYPWQYMKGKKKFCYPYCTLFCLSMHSNILFNSIILLRIHIQDAACGLTWKFYRTMILLIC